MAKPYDKTGAVVVTTATDHLDETTDALSSITYEHHEIHEGDMYSVDDLLACDNTTLLWLITTPNTTKYAHMIFGVDCTGEMTVLVTEGANRTTSSAALTPINRRRMSTNAATVVVGRGATGGTTNGATTIKNTRVGATGKFSTVGGSERSHEFILKANTKYVVSATTYATVYVALRLDWYEHTDL